MDPQKRNLVVLAAVLVCLAVVATVFFVTRDPGRIDQEGGVSALVAGPLPDGDLAGIDVAGELVVVGDDCLGLRRQGDGEEVLVLWPQGSRLQDRDGELALTWNSVTAGLGDAVKAMAIDVDDDWARDIGGDVPTGCLELPVVRLYEVAV